eukprot:791369_1
MPDKAVTQNMNAENSVDLTTKHTKSLAHNFSSDTGTSNLRVPPKKRRKTRRGRNAGASAEERLKISNASGRQDDRNISNANKEVRKREGTMKQINQSDSNNLVAIPNNIESFLRDVHEPIVKNDVPFFWHILKSGGTSVKDAIGMCLDLVEASESGILQGHDNDSSLEKVRIANGKIEYANVDTTTAKGISRAVSMQLVESEIADVIFSPLLHESTRLFDNESNHKGRVFCMFRHPIERAISLFYYLRDAAHEPTFSEKLKKIQSVEDYAVSEFAEHNWMTRFLTNTMTGNLTSEHLTMAKEILRRKVLVGLTRDMEASFERFIKYFGWDRNGISNDQKSCLKQYLFHGSNRSKNQHKVNQDSSGWLLLKEKNVYDLQLYDYVLQLYEDQREMLL